MEGRAIAHLPASTREPPGVGQHMDYPLRSGQARIDFILLAAARIQGCQGSRQLHRRRGLEHAGAPGRTAAASAIPFTLRGYPRDLTLSKGSGSRLASIRLPNNPPHPVHCVRGTRGYNHVGAPRGGSWPGLGASPPLDDLSLRSGRQRRFASCGFASLTIDRRPGDQGMAGHRGGRGELVGRASVNRGVRGAQQVPDSYPARRARGVLALISSVDVVVRPPDRHRSSRPHTCALSADLFRITLCAWSERRFVASR